MKEIIKIWRPKVRKAINAKRTQKHLDKKKQMKRNGPVEKDYM